MTSIWAAEGVIHRWLSTTVIAFVYRHMTHEFEIERTSRGQSNVTIAGVVDIWNGQRPLIRLTSNGIRNSMATVEVNFICK